MARYILVAAGVTDTAWRTRGLAVGAYTFVIMGEQVVLPESEPFGLSVFIVGIFSTKWSLRITNVIGVVKVLTLLL